MEWMTREQIKSLHALSDWKVKIFQRVGRIETKRQGLNVLYRLSPPSAPGQWLTLTEARAAHGLRLSGGEWAALERAGKWQVRRVDEQTFVRPAPVGTGASEGGQ